MNDVDQTSQGLSAWIFRRRRIIGLLAGATLAVAAGATDAATGPFSGFSGTWRGEGTIQFANGNKERIRCTTSYQLRGANGRDLTLKLVCASDSYKFDLAGDLSADASNTISGNWTEQSRHTGGSVNGNVRGDRIQLHVETSGFAADLVMVTSGDKQTVSIDAQGAGDKIQSEIALKRGN